MYIIYMHYTLRRHHLREVTPKAIFDCVMVMQFQMQLATIAGISSMHAGQDAAG